MTPDPVLPPLVGPHQLRDALRAHGHERIRVFDATTHIDQPDPSGPFVVRAGHDEYRRAHLSGAVFADMVHAFNDPSAALPNALVSAERFADAAGACGFGDGMHAVVYSQSTAMWATRLWWMFRYFGVTSVSVLNGGLTSWHASGGRVDSRSPSYPGRTLTAEVDEHQIVRLHELVDRLPLIEHGDLVNALSPDTSAGLPHGAAWRPGRIPGSLNVPWSSLVDKDGVFTDGLELTDQLGPDPIAYCGGGVAGTVVLFVLHLQGRHGRLYDGSLNEWSRHKELPLVCDPR